MRISGGGGGSTTPGGADTQVQFNDAGTMQGDAGLTYNKTTNFLTITSGGITLSSSTINKLTLTAPATGATLTIADGKTLTVSNTLTLAGTDATTMTFPTTSATIARTDAGQTFTGTQAFGAITASGTIVQTSASATAFESGPNGSTNPVLRLVNNVASQADGISITGNAAGSGTTITALSSGSNSSVEVIPKGTGSLYISPAGTQGNPRLALDVTNSGYYGLSSGTILVTTIAGADKAATHATNLQIVSNMQFGWAANTSDPTGSPDTGIARSAAGVLKLTNGSTGGADVDIPGNGIANGQNLRVGSLTENTTLSTGGATTDTTIQLPADSIILSVTARITTTIAGVDSTSVQIGDSAVATRFGTMSALSAGTTTVGINHMKGGVAADNAGPTQTTAASVRITLAGGADNTPSAGAVRITIHYISLTAATS